MITLTKEEKARRFDALQTAFSITRTIYDGRRVESSARYSGSKMLAADVIGAYNKGLSDAYAQMIEDLDRWMI